MPYTVNKCELWATRMNGNDDKADVNEPVFEDFDSSSYQQEIPVVSQPSKWSLFLFIATFPMIVALSTLNKLSKH